MDLLRPPLRQIVKNIEVEKWKKWNVWMVYWRMIDKSIAIWFFSECKKYNLAWNMIAFIMALNQWHADLQWKCWVSSRYQFCCGLHITRPGGMGGATRACPGGFLDFYNFHGLLQEKNWKIGEKMTKKRERYRNMDKMSIFYV